MSKRREAEMKALVLGAVVSAALCAPAFAADIAVKGPPRASFVSAPSPWYAVVGGAVLFSGGSTDLRDRDCSTSPFLPCGVTASIQGDGGWGVFGGIGYRFSPWLRGELRVGYGESQAEGDSNFPGFPGKVHGRYSSLSALVNAYVDIAGLFPGGMGGFEPYIGAGIGVSNNRIRSVTTDVFAGAVFLHTLSFPGGDNTEFAWTVSAGVAYRLSRNMLIDVAYRYRDFGMVRSDPGLASSTLFGTFPTNGFESRALAHGIDVAIRYEF
jgi:opacity protein-like surface antigen